MRKLTLILTTLVIGLYSCARDGEEEIVGELILNDLTANQDGDGVVISWTWNGSEQLDSVVIYLNNSRVDKVTTGTTYTHITTQTGTYKLIGYAKGHSHESNTKSTTPVSSSVTVYERSSPAGPSGLVVGSDYKFVTKSLNDADAPQKVYYYYTDCVPGSSSGPVYYLSSPKDDACDPDELIGFTIVSYIKEETSFNGVVSDPGTSTYERLDSNKKYALKFKIGEKNYYALATTGGSVGSSVTIDFKVQTIPNLRIIGQ